MPNPSSGPVEAVQARPRGYQVAPCLRSYNADRGRPHEERARDDSEGATRARPLLGAGRGGPCTPTRLPGSPMLALVPPPTGDALRRGGRGTTRKGQPVPTPTRGGQGTTRKGRPVPTPTRRGQGTTRKGQPVPTPTRSPVRKATLTRLPGSPCLRCPSLTGHSLGAGHEGTAQAHALGVGRSRGTSCPPAAHGQVDAPSAPTRLPGSPMLALFQRLPERTRWEWVISRPRPTHAQARRARACSRGYQVAPCSSMGAPRGTRWAWEENGRS